MITTREGFTLIELLVAMAIFAIAVAGFTSVLLADMSNDRLSREISDAAALAQDEMELEPTASGSDTRGIFTRTWTVTNDSPTAGARAVVISVSWRDLSTRSVTLRSVFAN
jgi:prepilin-type N-terminal cleavage/methylation domain-containing protein